MKSILIVLTAILLATVAAPWASQAPDGLERVASDLGRAEPPAPRFALVPDYGMPGVAGGLSTSLAGLAGVAVVLGLSLLMAGGRRSAAASSAS